jgi:hypothetical protein
MPGALTGYGGLEMRNKQDITVNKVSSLRDLMRDGDCRCRRLRYASPAVNKVSPLQVGCTKVSSYNLLMQ